MEILHDQRASGGTYRIEEDGHTASMDYSRISGRLIIFSSSVVPDEPQSQDLGQKLAEFVIDEARSGGWKIIPLCPYFKSQIEKHPEWQDVLPD